KVPRAQLVEELVLCEGVTGNGYQERDKNEDKIGQNQARDWKEREITSPTVPSDFIGPARNPLNGPGQPTII
ncbi:hypothetical protein Tco_1528975, partial [Tanacetum coccineum]